MIENILSKAEAFIARSKPLYSFLKKCKVLYQTGKYRLFKFFNKDKELIYNDAFFNKNLEWNVPIAEKMAAILIKHFNPKSIVDIGCGNAEFLWQFQKKGIEIKGYEGSPHAIEKSLVDKKFIEQFDLRIPIKLDKKYDLVLCLEVAEHIEKQYSQTLVDSLSKLSDRVVFTAAAPGQGGHFHINEQPREFWVNLWKEKGFEFDKELTDNIRQEFEANKIIWWYCTNLMIFKKA